MLYRVLERDDSAGGIRVRVRARVRAKKRTARMMI